MKEKELDQLYESEYQEVKYVRELNEYWNAYMYALINEIYVGIGINLGLKPDQAYKLAKEKPGSLQKAGFFKSIFDRFKGIFSYKVPKFRYKKKLFGDGRSMTDKQWKNFNKYLSDYWSKNTEDVSEDIAIKSALLGAETTEYREKKKPYKNKSLFQVEYDQFDGDMPSNIKQAYSRYDFNNSQKNAMAKSLSNIGMYITQTNNTLQEAIRQQITIGIDNNKTPTEIASDLYWQVEKNPNLNNEYTAESLRKNWKRIADTEIASVYEASILAPYEEEAMESMKDPEKAQYFVRTGGSCDWCKPRQGTLVRLVPASIINDSKSESLSSMGIKDPNTDVAIWNGKNNIGLKREDWMIACPAHPYNTATFTPIDLKEEYYNPKTDSVQKRQKKKKFVPQMEDYQAKVRKEEESRKPTYVGTNLVRYNNNLYEGVSASDYDRKLKEYQNNPQLPIPVNKTSPSYDRIFGEAEKNK